MNKAVLWDTIYTDLKSPSIWDRKFFSNDEEYFELVLSLNPQIDIYVPIRQAQILFRRRQFPEGLQLIANIRHPMATILNVVALIDINRTEGLEINTRDYSVFPEALCIANHCKSIVLSMRNYSLEALQYLAAALGIANCLGMQYKKISFLIEQKRQECLLGKYDSQAIEGNLDSITNPRILEFAHETLAEIYLCKGDFQKANEHAKFSGTSDLQKLIQILISPNSVTLDEHRDLALRLPTLYQPLKSFASILQAHLSIRENGVSMLDRVEYTISSNPNLN